MTQDEIIELAKQSGFHLTMWQLSLGCVASGTLDELEAFANLLAQHEREQCIKAIEDQIAWDLDDPAATAIQVIRARGQA